MKKVQVKLIKLSCLKESFAIAIKIEFLLTCFLARAQKDRFVTLHCLSFIPSIAKEKLLITSLVHAVDPQRSKNHEYKCEL